MENENKLEKENILEDELLLAGGLLLIGAGITLAVRGALGLKADYAGPYSAHHVPTLHFIAANGSATINSISVGAPFLLEISIPADDADPTALVAIQVYTNSSSSAPVQPNDIQINGMPLPVNGVSVTRGVPLLLPVVIHQNYPNGQKLYFTATRKVAGLTLVGKNTLLIKALH